MPHDAIIIGGGFAGLAAALQLARARRRVLVIDAGQPRNRFAAAAHGIFGHDGKPPLALLAEAAAQLRAYPTATVIAGEAVAARPDGDSFVVAFADGREEAGARLILATGIADELPPIAGLRERWGVTVLHCPYCHGYEVAEHALGVIAGHPLSAHQAALIPDWGPTTYFTQGAFEPDAEQAAHLEARGVRIERVPVVELLGAAPALEGVRLADGRVVPLRAVFTAPRTRIASPIPGQLGCGFEDGMLGPHLIVDAAKRTTVAGVFAAGDAASPMHNATLAMAAGVMAGLGAHQSLVMGTPAAAA